MKKKMLALVCALSLSAALFTGCGAKEESKEPEKKQEEQVEDKKEEKEDVVNLEGHTLMIYCGAGMQKPFEEIATAFKEATKCEINVTYANAGQIQSQINTSEEGDMFIAGSPVELQPVEGYVTSQKQLVKHIPVLAVAAGNPKGIKGLDSLTEEGITMIMGDVETTPIGKIAKKALTDAGIFDQVNIVANTTTAPQMAGVVKEGEADAAIIWKENCNVEGVEIVDTTDLDEYVKTIPAAVLSCAADEEALNEFNKYLDSDAAKEIWMKFGYELAQ